MTTTSALIVSSNPPRKEVSWLPLVTFIAWGGCLVIGLLGVAFPYARPQPPAPTVVPVTLVETMEVQLTQEIPFEPGPTATLEEPPPIPDLSSPPAGPPPMIVPVSAPSEAVAFALPVRSPSQVVTVKEAAYTLPAVDPTETAVSGPPTPVTRLTYGTGEGRQPPPRYPRQALREGQEGVVKVLFVVDSAGRVSAAEAIEPSPWPLLNREALRVIRSSWRFPNGAVRRYEVSIEFKIAR